MSEKEHFRDAVRFMTILPVRSAAGEIAPDWLTRCLKYSPLVGVGIGLVSGIVLLIATELWNETIAAMLAVAATIALTGALHEDGLADFADGCGSTDRARALEIMRDSRIGSYGVLALIVVTVSFLYLSFLIYSGTKLSQFFRHKKQAAKVGNSTIGLFFMGFAAKLALFTA